MFSRIQRLFRRGMRRLFAGKENHVERPVSQSASGGFGVPLDTALSGWFQAETGELFTGFPIDRGDTVLDVGCGDAPFSRFCATQGAHVLFTDIDRTKVSATRNALKKTPSLRTSSFVSNCDALPLESGTVDKVISLEVIEHVDNPKRFLAELVRVARPGALFLITAPDPVIEKLQKNNLAPDEYFKKPNHVRILERDGFAGLVESAGLDIQQRERFGFYWSMWWVFFWACGQEISPPWHPLLQSWTTTWSLLLESEDGPRIKRALDDFMPKTQLIIARKP